MHSVTWLPEPGGSSPWSSLLCRHPINVLARLEGHLLQKPQLLLGGVISHLEHSCLHHRHPEIFPQARGKRDGSRVNLSESKR
jgi:hypothetical protein